MKYPSANPINPNRDPLWLATLINPKDHKLYQIITEARSHHCSVTAATRELNVVGVGYIDTDDEKDVGGDTYVRSHSPGSPSAAMVDAPARDFQHDYSAYVPNGVIAKGRALGLLLYSGLSLLASTYRASGIFSITGDRSPSAEAFWEAQVDNRYAEEDTTFESDQEEVEIDISEAAENEVYHRTSEGWVFESVYPEHVSAEVSLYKDTTMQLLKTEAVLESGMVLFYDDSLITEDRPAYAIPGPLVLTEVDLEGVDDTNLLQAYLNTLVSRVRNDSDQKLVEEYVAKNFNSPAIKNDPKLVRQIQELLGQQQLFVANRQPKRRKTHNSAWQKHFGSLINSKV